MDLSLNSDSQNHEYDKKLSESKQLARQKINYAENNQLHNAQIMMLDEQDNEDDIAVKDRNRHHFDQYNFSLSQNEITFIDKAKDESHQLKQNSNIQIYSRDSIPLNNQNQLSGLQFESNIFLEEESSIKQQKQQSFQVKNQTISDIIIQKNNSFSGELASQLKTFQSSEIFKTDLIVQNLAHNQISQQIANQKRKISQFKQLDNLFDDQQNLISEIQNEQESKNSQSQNHSQGSGQSGQNSKLSVKCQDKTITFLDQFTIASRISEQQPSGTSILKSLNNFLNSIESIYKPYCVQLQQLFQNVDSYSIKSIQNMLMHLSFFTQKNKQQSAFLKRLQNTKSRKIYESLQQNQVNNLVYIDSKIVLRQMHQNMQVQIKQTRIFNQGLLKIFKSLKEQIQPIVEKRYAKQKKITQYIKTIKKLQQQLRNVIQFRNQLSSGAKHLNDFDFQVQNPYLKKDHYLQVKYIMEKQQEYLRKIQSLSKHIIIFANSVFMDDQIVASVKIRQALMDYQQIYLDYNYQLYKIKHKKCASDKQVNEKDYEAKYQALQKKVDALQDTDIDLILKQQIAKIAYKAIPNSILQHLGFQNTKNKQKIGLQTILNKLNNYFQNQVFMSTVQMENEYVFYRKEGFWMQKQEITNKASQQKQKISVVLTTNKYMHLQIGEKLATMKLSDVKIAKKAKYLILTDKGKGLVGYFVGNNTQLGRIQLQTPQQVNFFANKIKQLLEA